MPMAAHREIRTSPEIQAVIDKIGTTFASEASDFANIVTGNKHFLPAEYGHDLHVSESRARANVWAINSAAFHAENKDSPLDFLLSYFDGHRWT